MPGDDVKNRTELVTGALAGKTGVSLIVTQLGA